ncbi:hypothetical protein J3F83DRAFT_744139 [Trichoderma novae-zelandiae]
MVKTPAQQAPGHDSMSPTAASDAPPRFPRGTEVIADGCRNGASALGGSMIKVTWVGYDAWRLVPGYYLHTGRIGPLSLLLPAYLFRSSCFALFPFETSNSLCRCPSARRQGPGNMQVQKCCKPEEWMVNVPPEGADMDSAAMEETSADSLCDNPPSPFLSAHVMYSIVYVSLVYLAQPLLLTGFTQLAGNCCHPRSSIKTKPASLFTLANSSSMRIVATVLMAPSCLRRGQPDNMNTATSYPPVHPNWTPIFASILVAFAPSVP